MDEFFRKLLDSSDFPARWHCGNWTTGHGWLHVGSDVAVFSAYTTIPLVLVYFILRRRDLPFPRIFWMFVAFIAFCGLSHLTEAYIFWNPIYRVSGLLKLATAIVSWATVLALVRTMPRAMELKSPEELERQVTDRTRELERNRARLRRLNDELQAANDEIKQYAYIVAHDLQSPLHAIKSFASILDNSRSAPPSPLEQECMSNLFDGLEHMESLTADLLAYAKADEEASIAVDVDTHALVTATIADLRAPRRGEALDVTLSNLPIVRGDETKLRQVFQNLIGNAVKFAGSAPPKIEVRGHEQSDGWRFEVSDEGIGFDPRHAERIFEPFQRLHLEGEYEGTGIGLSIVRKLVRRHGGTITVRSAPGAGTSFSFTLPHRPPFDQRP